MSHTLRVWNFSGILPKMGKKYFRRIMQFLNEKNCCLSWKLLIITSLEGKVPCFHAGIFLEVGKMPDAGKKGKNGPKRSVRGKFNTTYKRHL